jgi:hypothetical protein
MSQQISSPFPGMDPFLESPVHWEDCRSRLINALAEAITDGLPCRWTVRDVFPRLAVPLRSPELDVEVDLQAVFGTASRRGRYDRRVGYSVPVPPPSMAPEDQSWAAVIAIRGNATG